MKITTLIIDDEPRIVTLLQQCLREFESIEVVAVGYSATEAAALIKQHNPRLVFLDISMPGPDVFDMLAAFESREFEVVFVTAHDQYALKAFEENALSYLLKPINMQKLAAVIERCQNIIEKRLPGDTLPVRENPADFGKISIPTHYGHILVQAENIVRCEGEGNYTAVFTKDRKKIFGKPADKSNGR
jgi:two-component system LytT family response regulator